MKWHFYRDAYPVGGGRHRGSAVDLPAKNRAKETDLVSSNIRSDKSKIPRGCGFLSQGCVQLHFPARLGYPA